jgi:hypothetical protein
MSVADAEPDRALGLKSGEVQTQRAALHVIMNTDAL